jgi:PAS domain-containing protein
LPGSFSRRESSFVQWPWIIVAFVAAPIIALLSSLAADAVLAERGRLLVAATIGLLTTLLLIGSMWWITVRNAERERAVIEALRESERRFRLLINGVTDSAIYILDPDGRVAKWNSGAEHIKGYSEQEIIGESFERF